MTQDTVLTIGRTAIWTALKVAAPVLGMTLAVGLTVSIIQATTQIHEQTMTFAPKIVAAMVSLLLFGPWMLRQLMDITSYLLGNAGSFVR